MVSKPKSKDPLIASLIAIITNIGNPGLSKTLYLLYYYLQSPGDIPLSPPGGTISVLKTLIFIKKPDFKQSLGPTWAKYTAKVER